MKQEKRTIDGISCNMFAMIGLESKIQLDGVYIMEFCLIAEEIAIKSKNYVP